MKPFITEEMKQEILDVITPLSENDKAFTREDVEEAFSCGEDKARKILHILRNQGLLMNVFVYREGLDGRIYKIPAYSLIPAK